MRCIRFNQMFKGIAYLFCFTVAIIKVTQYFETKGRRISLDTYHNQIGDEERDIYWSENSQQLVEKGWTFEESLAKIAEIKKQNVTHLERSNITRCGQYNNAFVVLSSGMEMCVRKKRLRYTLGDLLSSYLALLLGMDNVPVVTLSKLDRMAPLWINVNYTWLDGAYVSFARIIPNITGPGSHVPMPPLFRKAIDEKFTIDNKRLSEIKMAARYELELLQWGTMVIFDYLTLNVDRMAHDDVLLNHSYPLLVRAKMLNILRSPTNGKFWLYDNEFGVL